MIRHKLKRGRLGALAVALLGAMVLTTAAHAGGKYGGTGLAGGFRWDAAARIFGGNERSLQGSLRYSVEGGSWQAYRDMFTWTSVPSLATFQQTVEEAFGAWTAVDPVTGLGTSLSFVADFATPTVEFNGGGVNINGAEIDLVAATSAGSWGNGSTGTQGETFFNATVQSDPVTLTSGTTGYAGGAIIGADVKLNNNPGAVYSVDVFRLLLSHEIGHALGFADADVQAGVGGTFIDDNYNGSSAANALATLTNSWALLVDPLNPSASPLNLFTVANGNPGIDTPGVNILMESEGLGGQFGNLSPLSNDDYGIRQFLYPSLNVVPESGTFALMVGGGLTVLGTMAWKRKKVS